MWWNSCTIFTDYFVTGHIHAKFGDKWCLFISVKVEYRMCFTAFIEPAVSIYPFPLITITCCRENLLWHLTNFITSKTRSI